MTPSSSSTCRSGRAAPLLFALTAAAVHAAAADGPRVDIPLCAGLTIVTAIEDPKGDYESIKRVTRVTADRLDLAVNGDRPTPTGVRKIKVSRSVRLEDLRDATFYLHTFDSRAPAMIPGSTALGTSTAVLSALKTTGKADLDVVDPVARAAPPEEMRRNLFRYPLTRVGIETVPVTVNGARVDLPVVHAAGRNLGDRAEFFFLDDERNPLTIKYAFGAGNQGDDTGRLQVVRISYACTSTPAAVPPESRLEQALREQGRADVYDIYFEFNSDRIREESEATLQEIAGMLRRHPDWKLGIGGHTDSVASDSYNLDLSRRRADAVKAALTTGYGVDALRLTTAGYGESRPKDRNDTLEGRARNRRVELVRQP
jgi:outer membrane protein OmpA-like peptidoglycan-associated protein